MKMLVNKINWMYLLLAIILLGSCKDKVIGENPYDSGEPPLAIKFQNLNRKLDAVRPNESLLLNVRGIGDEQKSSLNVFVNEQKAEILAHSDSTLTIKIPEAVSSGIVKLMVGNQVFYGPRVYIEGKTKVDVYFESGIGFNGGVYTILPFNNNYFIGGSFSNYKDEAKSDKDFRNNIHLINQSGNSQGNNFGRGIENGFLTDIKKLYDGRLILSGNLYSFNRRETNGIAIINQNGELQTQVVDIINATGNNSANGKDTVSVFNGQLYGTVRNVYPTADSTSVIAVGNFNYYSFINYKYSSRYSRVYTYTNVNSVAKLKLNGKLDSTFQYNNTGINGTIMESTQLSNGKIIIVGAFTQYNGQSARNILVINENGTVDATFAGTGANNWIESVNYNPITKKIGLAGRFTEYNGRKVNGAVVLNESGTIDNTFEFKNTNGRFPDFIHLLNNGKVFISGSFNEYDGILRNSFLILDSNGHADQNYNNLGGFSGFITKVIETKSSEGFPALLIGGVFNTIEGVNAGSIMRLEIKD